MAQHHPNTEATDGRRMPARAHEAPRRARAASAAAIAPGVGRKCQGGHRGTTAGRDRQRGAAGALELRPPILVGMTEEQEAAAVALLAELFEGLLARRRPPRRT